MMDLVIACEELDPQERISFMERFIALGHNLDRWLATLPEVRQNELLTFAELTMSERVRLRNKRRGFYREFIFDKESNI